MNSRRVRALLFACALFVAGFSNAPTFSADEAPALSQEQLDQMLAPIALYPDPLLSQIFMASTYPLEVVEAARWSKANPSVTGDNAVKAVAQETWDPSVKSLAAFPSVLSMMNDKLDWTQQLGDAFLADQARVMQTVQGLRKKAQQAGQLKSSEQQTVTTQNQTIIIQPAQPQVVYVPTYNPTVVYGAWPYPAYPPVYFPPPPGAAFAAAVSFGVGIAVADAMFSDCDWGHNDININVNRYNNINVNNINRNTNINNVNRNTNIDNRTTNTWQHDASHRKGVAYRDNATQSRYAGSTARTAGNVDARKDYRGYDGGNAAGSGSTRPSSNVGTSQRDAGAAQRSSTNTAASTRVASAPDTRSSALSSSGNRNIEQAASSRGRSSTQGMQYDRGGGGGGGAGGRGGGGFSRRR
jgi:uncharacterized protein DUF3300